MSEQDNKIHAVLYIDGSYHAKHSAGGWGIHGYTFTPGNVPEKEPRTKIYPTVDGYVDHCKGADPINVNTYLDVVGGGYKVNDNNHAELVAFREALKLTKENGYSDVKVYSDSKAVVQGVNDYMPRWKTMGWRTGTGTDVAYKNDWMAVDQLMTELKDSPVKLAWIKGHSGIVGNEFADGLAGRGSSISINGDEVTWNIESPADTYLKKPEKIHRFFDFPKWYFSSDKDEKTTSKCGRHVYWTGNHGKEDEYVGKPQADSALAVLLMKDKVEILEQVREHFVTQDRVNNGYMFVGILRNLLSDDVVSDIVNFGMRVFRKNSADLSLVNHKRLPVVHHVNPTGLAYYNVDNLTVLSQILEQYIDGDKSIVTTDLTEHFIESTEVKGKLVKKALPTFTNNVKHMDLMLNYNLGLASELRKMDEIPLMTSKVRLIIGSDILGRNAISALAADIVKIVAVTWRESDATFRYATIVETVDDIGIWANPYGNFKLINP